MCPSSSEGSRSRASTSREGGGGRDVLPRLLTGQTQHVLTAPAALIWALCWEISHTFLTRPTRWGRLPCPFYR